QQLRARLERIAVDDDDIRELARLEGAELVALQRRGRRVLREDRDDVLRREQRAERAQLVDQRLLRRPRRIRAVAIGYEAGLPQEPRVDRPLAAARDRIP